MRLGREDFEASNRKRDDRRGDYWFVCEKYELRTFPDDEPPASPVEHNLENYYLTPKYEPSRDWNRWKVYSPLEEAPNLFLSFARLFEREYSSKPVTDLGPVLAWVHRHGLLGMGTPWNYGERGEHLSPRTDESVEWFLNEASKAYTLLRMYEAVLAGNPDAAKAAMDFRALSSRSFVYWTEYFETSYAADPIERALETAMMWVEGACSPALIPGDDRSDPSGVRAGWRFKNLQEAMNQQMFWLMASGGNVTRCKFCGELVGLSAPHEDKRKPPQHKTFCDRRCQQSYYYHTKVKPARQRKKA